MISITPVPTGGGGTDDDDRRSAIRAALRPILAVELMLTDGRYQTMLASYRQACLQKDEHEMRRIEQLVAEKEEEPDRRADVPFHAVG